MKKGELAGQIFVYIVTIILIGMVLLYGYRAIDSFRKRSEEVSYLKFKTELESAVKLTASDYGSVKREAFDVSGGYQGVCFVDLDNINVNSNKDIAEYPLIKDSIAGGVKDWNVYFPNMEADPFYIGKIYVQGGFLCLPATSGKLTIRIEGRGDRAVISA